MSSAGGAPPSSLPGLYGRWMSQASREGIPSEPRANCSACSMCAPAGHAPRAGELFFRPDTKCCTHMPGLPNFLVGRALLDDDPEMARGRATLEARIARGVAVTPLGLGQPPEYLGARERLGEAAFGREPGLLCPHFRQDTGGCGIWRNRPSACSTWFCKHERGAVGLAYWQALHRLLSAVEISVARWCVAGLGIAGPADSAQAWGAWRGREREFYAQCAHRVEPLDWAGVRDIGGAAVTAAERALRDRRAELLDTRLPANLRAGRFDARPAGPGLSLVVGYSQYDALQVPDAVLGRVRSGDVGGLAAPQRRQLLDFGVLRSAPDD